MAETPRDSAETPRDTAPAGDAPGARADRTRATHDRGGFRDKIPVADPAATPLGTDSEASGGAAAAAPEGSRPPGPTGGPSPGTPHPSGQARGDVPRGATRWFWVGGAALVAMLAGLLPLFFLR